MLLVMAKSKHTYTRICIYIYKLCVYVCGERERERESLKSFSVFLVKFESLKFMFSLNNAFGKSPVLLDIWKRKYS